MEDLKSFRAGDTIEHSIFGAGRIINVLETDPQPKWFVDFENEGKKAITATEDTIVGKIETAPGGFNYEDLKDAIREVINEELPVSEIELGDRWTGGKMVLYPNSDDLQPKEIPLEAFFHKIVMIRDRIRVMEQKINSNSKITDEEKVEFHQYITRIYGTLTTFNVLFRDREDWFSGQKG
ncbi:MAG: hypothetical protein GY863_06160 [bacterium]|nr:hypothetical protein [bacterium]